jgi:hypothetical protein
MLRLPTGSGAELQLRRFASGYRFLSFTPAAWSAAELRLPRDNSSLPWHLRVLRAPSVRLCQAPT